MPFFIRRKTRDAQQRSQRAKKLVKLTGLFAFGVCSAAASDGQIGSLDRGVAGHRPVTQVWALAAGTGLAVAASLPAGSRRTNPAATALLRQAKAEAQAGRGEQAAATLERALAIEPRNPWLWHRLAVLKLQLGNAEQAVQFAKRSNALATGQRRLLGGNWEVIARSLEHAGDKKGAAKAQRRAREYLSDIDS